MTNERPQDVGRVHSKRIEVAVETAVLYERYLAAMRLEVAEILGELFPTSGQLTLVGDLERPPLDRRATLWGLAVKLGRELAAAPAISEPRETPSPQRDQPAPKLTIAQRRALGL